jgi:hypothetical protein
MGRDIGGIKDYDSGGQTFRYDRRTHTRIRAVPGTAQFATEIAAIRAAHASHGRIPGTFGNLLREFEASDEFKVLDRKIQRRESKALTWLTIFSATAAEKIDDVFVRTCRRRARDAGGVDFARQVFSTLHAALDWAVARGDIEDHPLKKIKPQRRKQSSFRQGID